MSAWARLYRVVTALGEPLAPWVVARRARGESPALRAERLGRGPFAAVDVWWHAASLGEVGALRPVLAEARARFATLRHAVTTTTAAGRREAAALEPTAALAPLDLPRATARALDGRRPRSLVLVETELWPNLVLAARARGVRTGMVNARISDRSWEQYRKFRSLTRTLLGGMDAVAARGEADAARLRELGARPDALRVTGNLKLDGAEAAAPLALPWGERPTLTAASAHPGEADAILAAFDALRRDGIDARLVVAPRHLDTAGFWMERLAAAGLATARRSAPAASDGGALVLLLDTHGELRAALAASRAAVLGGTFVTVGGHNPLEAAAAGVPQVVGPWTANAAAECDALVEGGGARRAARSDELAPALRGWFLDPASGERDGGRARAVVEAARGASARTVDWLVARGLLDGGGER